MIQLQRTITYTSGSDVQNPRELTLSQALFIVIAGTAPYLEREWSDSATHLATQLRPLVSHYRREVDVYTGNVADITVLQHALVWACRYRPLNKYELVDELTTPYGHRLAEQSPELYRAAAAQFRRAPWEICTLLAALGYARQAHIVGQLARMDSERFDLVVNLVVDAYRREISLEDALREQAVLSGQA